MRVLVLGGAGAMGREIVRELLSGEPRCEVTVADVRCDFYRQSPPAWVCKFQRRLRWKEVNLLREPARLARILRGHLAMINVTTHHLNLPAMRAALRARTHYIDLGGLFHYTRRQLKLHKEFARAGRLAILGMGCAPGLSNLLAAWAVEALDRVDSIHIKVGSRDLAPVRLPPGFVVVPYAVGTIREELTLKPWVYSRGRFRAVRPRSGAESFAFPPPVGRQGIFNTLHSEVATLPLSFRGRGVRDVSFKIGFDQPLIDALLHPSKNVKLVTPVASRRIRDLETTCAVATGSKGGKKVKILAFATVRSRGGVSGGTLDTAVPPAVAARLLPAIKKVGVYPPEQAIPLGPFFTLIRRRGVALGRKKLKG